MKTEEKKRLKASAALSTSAVLPPTSAPQPEMSSAPPITEVKDISQQVGDVATEPTVAIDANIQPSVAVEPVPTEEVANEVSKLDVRDIP